MAHLISTIHTLKSYDNTWRAFFSEDAKAYATSTARTAEVLKKLEDSLSAYRDTKRLDVVRPFACLFDPVGTRDADEMRLDAPSHRGLFWAFSYVARASQGPGADTCTYSYQFSLIGWSLALLEVFKETANIEKKRRRPRCVLGLTQHRHRNSCSPVQILDARVGKGEMGEHS